MQKVLAVITNEDKEKGIMLSSLLATYTTILKIEKYEIDKNEVQKKIVSTQKKLRSFWSYIAEKYMFPLYLNAAMKINNEDNSVYIDI